MKSLFLRNWVTRIKTILFFFAALFLISTSITHGHWEIGERDFIEHDGTDRLKVKFDKNSLKDIHILNEVGGVALTATAKPDNALVFNNITLDYLPGAPDSQRLEIRIDGNIAGQTLPDWMLIPIAKFADSEFNAAVSLFGPGTGPCKEGVGTEYDIVFHPALHNTLLGLRIMQSDILFIDLNQLWKLPHWVLDPAPPPGEAVTGLLEEIPSEPFNWYPLAKEIFETFNEDYQSWVLNDIDQDIVFNVVQNKLTLSGRPYYYFWRYQSGTVYEASQLTAAMRNKMGQQGPIKKLVPFMYNAVIQTTRYAAFFRYVKAHYPATWSSFMNKINTVQPAPAILTPEIWKLCIVGTTHKHKNNFSKISVYPNPTSGIVRFEIPETLKGKLNIQVFDPSGRNVFQETHVSAGITETLQVDLGRFPSGLYLLQVTDGRQIALGKILKQ